MDLFGTATALGVLSETSNAAGLDGRVHDRLGHVQALFTDELARMEADLADVASRGEAPAPQAARHLIGSGGKRIRPLTTMLCAACFGAVPRAAVDLAIVAELIHSATLLHDDVVDDGTDRRGKLAARKLWGNAVSVLTGDLLLTHALDRTLASAPEAMPDLLCTLRRLVDGEIVQLRGRTILDVTEATYLRILQDKTASLFGWAARAGARVGGANAEQLEGFGRFGESLGLAFQLVDDVLDYCGDPAATGKTLLSDLSEGKVTLPLVLALRDDVSLEHELELARNGDQRAAGRLGVRVRASDACDRVRRRASDETSRAIAALETVPPSPARYVLAEVAAELARRTG
jgi:octaprenyl-diphosphate synthase